MFILVRVGTGTQTYATYFFSCCAVGLDDALGSRPMVYDQPKTRHKGYVWRLLRKLPPFKQIPGDNPLASFQRFMVLIGILLAATWPLRERYADPIYWGILIVLILDDHFNGDDDERKKRWETIKNKIKWRPYKPAAIRVKA